ncbi:alanine racemase [Cystoisospora suis]|uniref:Alanine racemase n=1 Tax=Cystoisospora suis TaxID=483139 RepID=A0A2C6KTW3_9APIC|nr:alanine racemase [Cystoisospora suis]
MAIDQCKEQKANTACLPLEEEERLATARHIPPCTTQEKSSPLLLVDSTFAAYVGGLGKCQLPLSDSWGDRQALCEAFCAGVTQDIVDLSADGGVLEEDLPGLSGRVCSIRGLIQQPMNTEFYAGAVACPSFGGDGLSSRVWHTTKYRDQLLSCSRLQPTPCSDITCEDATATSSLSGTALGDSPTLPTDKIESPLTDEFLSSDYFDPRNGHVQIWNRWPYRCVAVPGETPWCSYIAGQRIESSSYSSDSDNLNKKECTKRRLTEFTIVLYGQLNEQEGERKLEENGEKERDSELPDQGLLLNDLVHAIGILSVGHRPNEDVFQSSLTSSSLCSSNRNRSSLLRKQGKAWCLCNATEVDTIASSQLLSSPIVRLHVFAWKRLCYFNPAVDLLLLPPSSLALEEAGQKQTEDRGINPAALMLVEGLKKEEKKFAEQRSLLLQYLAEAVQGDLVAAEYLLLALFCRRPTSATTSAFSRLRLNLLVKRTPSDTSSNSKTADKTPGEAKKAGEGKNVQLAGVEPCDCTSACGQGEEKKLLEEGSRCACFFSEASGQLMNTLQAVVPRLVAVSVRPAALARANLAPKLLFGDETEEETKMARGVLQLAHGTVLIIDEPEAVSSQNLEKACHQLAMQERQRQISQEASVGLLKREIDQSDLASGNNTYSTKDRASCKENSPGEVSSGKENEESKKKAQLLQKAAANLHALECLLSEGHVEYDFVYSKQQIRTDLVPICCTTTSSPSVFSSHVLHLPVEKANNKIDNGKGESQRPGAHAEHTAQKTCEACVHGPKETPSEDPRDQVVRQQLGKETNNEDEPFTEEDFFRWRALIGMSSRRVDGVNIDEETRQAMIDDWVQIRQKDRTVKMDDFPVWLVLADAMAASFGEGLTAARSGTGEQSETGNLKIEHWRRVIDLETQRRSRVAALAVSDLPKRISS